VNRLFCPALTILFVVLAFSVPFAEAGTYSGGTGEPNSPYLIGSADDIIEMSNEPNDWDYCFVMIADVNMVGYTFTTAVIAPDEDNTNYIFDGTSFTGIFDGADHNILNLTIDNDGPDNDYVGLFGQISGEQAQVKNLGLAKVTVIGGDISSYLGGLCGRNIGAVSNCYSTGIVVSGRGNFTGGMCGSNSGTISNCYSESSASGGDYSRDIGGMCGCNYGTIINCYAAGSVTGGTDSKPLGGLCGDNRGTIINCYAAGPVSGGSESIGVGGLCGINYDTITNCYATGSVEGSTDLEGSYDLGGLCGYNRGTISNCFWDTDTSGIETSDGGTGLPTSDMQKIITFTDAGWDFVGETDNGTNEIWQIPPDSYPLLSSLSGYVPLELAGDGTLRNPYLISDANELGAIYHYPSSAHYKLTTDIDLTGIIWSFAPIPYFDGTFDGAGYTITNLTINGGSYLGLFGRINSGQVRNLGLKDISIIGGDYSYYLGALCGKNVDGTISNSYSTGLVSGNGCLGGLCGKNVDGTISNSYSIGLVSGDDCLGGLCGWILKGTISNCYSTGSVSGNEDIGGLCGVSGDLLVSTLGGTISNCYSTGSVNGNEDIGGLCGQNYYGTISSSFWNIDTSGTTDGVGNLDPDPSGVIGKTTTEMQTLSTFTTATWDFVDESTNGTNDIWRMCVDGIDYPHLSWEYSINGDFACPDGVGPDDLISLSGNWLNSEEVNPGFNYPCDPTFDGVTNLADYAVLAEKWLSGN